MPLTDEELYEGFSPKEREQLKEYETEARDRWGEMAAESQRRVRQMSKAQWQAVQDEGDAATRLMGEYIVGGRKYVPLSFGSRPDERKLRRHITEEAGNAIQQTLQGAVQAIGGDLAFEPQPDVFDRIQMRAVLG